MDIFQLERTLFENLEKPLPGESAHSMMSPAGRKEAAEYLRSIGTEPRHSAVLILFYPDSSDTRMVMIKRPDYDGVHSGQIAFPGGKTEESDPSYEYTALREAFEEIGIIREQVKVLGRLSDLYIPPSNFMVHPVVAIAPEKPVFTPDPYEVARVLEISWEEWTQSEIAYDHFITSGKIKVKSPFYALAGEKVWGASAMILSELREIVLGTGNF